MFLWSIGRVAYAVESKSILEEFESLMLRETLLKIESIK